MELKLLGRKRSGKQLEEKNGSTTKLVRANPTDQTKKGKGTPTFNEDMNQFKKLTDLMKLKSFTSLGQTP